MNHMTDLFGWMTPGESKTFSFPIDDTEHR
jgi:hypothetical protein